jgi:cytochrome c2
MKEQGIPVPELSGQEMADIVAYLYTAHYFDPVAGSTARGEKTAQARGCLGCHAVGGKGGRLAGDLATSNVVGSPSALVAAMWNSSRAMEEMARKQGIALSRLTGGDLADLSALLRSVTKPPVGTKGP